MADKKIDGSSLISEIIGGSTGEFDKVMGFSRDDEPAGAGAADAANTGAGAQPIMYGISVSGGLSVGAHHRQLHADPDVYLVRVPFMNVSTSETNAYFIVSDGECLVVDTGAPTDEGAAYFNAAVDELGIDRSRMSFFLTHLHLDHAGLIDWVASPAALIYTSHADFDFMASNDENKGEESDRRVAAEGFARDAACISAHQGMGRLTFDPAGRDMRFVAEGDTVRVGSVELEVVETGGHTAGHISLYHRASGLLFSGDHILFSLSPSLALRPGVYDTMATYLANLRKVSELEPSRLLHSHGDLRDDWRERIEWLIKHHSDRLDETVGLVAAHPGATGDEVVRAIKWNVPKAWDDINIWQRYCIIEEGVVILDHLVAAGRIVRTPDAEGINRYTVADA